MIEFDKFKLSLKHLELQFNNYKTLDASQPEIIHEAVAESVIQRFEVCYDCMWKVLKRYLTEELGIPDVPNSPKPVIRLANENNLFVSPLEQWFAYAATRIDTSHDYSGEKAENALDLIGNFIRDAIGLYQMLSGKSWE